MNRAIDRPARIAASSLLALPLALTLAACLDAPLIPEGHFSCDPNDPASCPAELDCLRPAGQSAYLCYARADEGSCGNNKVEQGEACDGSYKGAQTCQDLGFWSGELTCGADCKLDTTGCLRMTTVAAGGYAACGLDSDHSAWCWGRKDSGQLGAGYVRSGARPVQVSGGSGFTALTGGLQHFCGLNAQGAWCWGSNLEGQLGDGSKEIKIVPSQVIKVPRLVSITAGHFHTCGLDAEGRAWCWGRNSEGQLGAGVTSVSVSTPYSNDKSALRFSQLAVGAIHTCGIEKKTGQGFCWGQLGNTSQLQPQAVAGYTLKAIAASAYNTCAVTTKGQGLCWGQNKHGQLGNGQQLDAYQKTPQVVFGNLAWATIVPSEAHTCGLDTKGRAWCWGRGPLGDGQRAGSRKPVHVGGKLTFSALSVHNGYACASSGKTVLCWGWNGSAQAGQLRQSAPRKVSSAQTFTRIAAGLYHTCALDAASKAWCWGYNGHGNLGSGSFDPSLVPAQVVGGLSFKDLTCGHRHTCGIGSDGLARCWGANALGPLGVNTSGQSSEKPLTIDKPSFKQLSAGVVHTCGIAADDKAWCWGGNHYGQLGDGSVDPLGVHQPVAVSGGHTFRSIGAGMFHTCGVDVTGKLYCWGNNRQGQLGTGDRQDVMSPSAVSADPAWTFTKVASGEQHSCAVQLGGSQLHCWGSNASGQLGIGTDVGLSLVPGPVQGALEVQQVAAAAIHSCALDALGRAWCWGTGREQQLGLGKETIFVPARVKVGTTFKMIAVGNNHTCAIDLGGSIWCWGDNGDGQLGLDDHVLAPAPLLEPRAPDVVL